MLVQGVGGWGGVGCMLGKRAMPMRPVRQALCCKEGIDTVAVAFGDGRFGH